MNASQEQLLSLLTIAIHGGVPAYETFSSMNGEELFNLALQQDVYSILYTTLNKYREELKLDEQIMRRWKEATLYMAARQMMMINGIRTILVLFESNGIPVISLKGLVLKQLYSQPELRNMSDIDLLIDEKNIEKSIELLSTQGYLPKSKDLNNPRYMHIVMEKSGSFSVELHRTLWHPTIMKTKDDQIWLNHIWQNKRLVTMEGFQFNALSLEDELINLIVHLARHVMESGAQLRQLCDFVLFIKCYRNMLDFEYVDQTIKSMELYTFYQNLFTTCHMFLGLTIPINNDILDKSEILINLIYSSLTNKQAIDKSKSWRTISSSNTFACYNKVLISLVSGLDIGLQFIRKIKVILKSITFMTRSIRFFQRFKAKNQYLRSIGLYIKY